MVPSTSILTLTLRKDFFVAVAAAALRVTAATVRMPTPEEQFAEMQQVHRNSDPLCAGSLYYLVPMTCALPVHSPCPGLSPACAPPTGTAAQGCPACGSQLVEAMDHVLWLGRHEWHA